MDDIIGTQINPNIYKCKDTITFSVNIPDIKDNNKSSDEDDKNSNLINTDTCYYKFSCTYSKSINKKSLQSKQPWYVSQINKNHNKKHK